MRDVMALRDERQAAIADRPFFRWLRSDRVPSDKRLMFAPMMAFFTMQFRDMNRWVLRFPEPHDEFHWVINAGTLEDETHSRIFIEDWRKLGLDERLGWQASETLWWLFLSDEQEVLRRSGIDFVSLAVDDGDDPLIRYGHSEAGEATGHVFLKHSSRIATELARRTGLDYRYFGRHHLDLETGHVANIEGVFEEQRLDAQRRARAMEMCTRMFDIFERIFDAFMAYAHNYVETDTVPRRPATTSRPTPEWWGAEPARVHPIDRRDVEVHRLLLERKTRAAAHPFYAWLREADGVAPMQKLQRFIPMWLVDVMGYRDLNRYAMSYANPKSDAEGTINAWARRLATHSSLFLSDWDALGLDDLLGFSASQTLEFVFLDPDMDLHREHMMDFVKLALRYGDPTVRWWMMTALESTGEAFFSSILPLARAAEDETGLRLDYLCGRHDPPGPSINGGHSAVAVPPAPLDADQREVVLGLIEKVFDSMESQLWRSLALARANKFGVPTKAVSRA